MSERNIAQMFEGPAHNLVWKNRYNEIIDEVYDKYDELFDSYYPAFSAPYPKRLTKEELVQEIKNGEEIRDEFQMEIKITERKLSLEERHQLALPIWKEKYGPLADMMVPTNVDNTPYKIPRKLIKVTYNNEIVEYYE
jgi:hypothetical protein